MSSSDVQRQLWILGLFPLSEHIAWSSSFPYIYAMVRSFNNDQDEDKQNTALYASLLVSCFTFGEFLMAPQWARISDSIGRKPTLLVGSFGAICSAAAFGLSISLPMALAARFFAGALNPNLGVLKTYVGELVSKDKQARGFSTMSFMAGLGAICGPVVGGYLAEPTRTIPSLFPSGSVWERFPYLLPNLLIMACLGVSSILGFFLLEEVHAKFRGSGDDSDRRSSSRFWAFLRYRRDRKRRGSHAALLPESDEPSEPARPAPDFVFGQAFTKQIKLQILSLTLQSFKDIATMAIVPVFLESPQPSENGTSHRTLGGGFGLSTDNTSTILLTQAIASILGQWLVIPQLVERWGALRCYRLALVGFFITYILMPTSVLLQGKNGILLFTFILWTQALWFGISNTSVSMMITNNCRSPIYLATINGVAASCGCLAKTAGPALIGMLYDRGVEQGNIGTPFWTLGGVAILTLGLTAYLQDGVETE